MKTDQTELFPISHDYSKIKRELPEQLPLSDLPIFNAEYQHTEQTNLFKCDSCSVFTGTNNPPRCHSCPYVEVEP